MRVITQYGNGRLMPWHRETMKLAFIHSEAWRELEQKMLDDFFRTRPQEEATT